MCGIGGVFSKRLLSGESADDTASLMYELLLNRGSDSHGSLGINFPDMDTIKRIRENTSIKETRHPREIYSLISGSNAKLFQTRFTTNGERALHNAQPIIVYTSDGERIEVFDGTLGNPLFSKDVLSGKNAMVVVHNGEIRIPGKENIFSERGHDVNIPEGRSDSTLFASYLLSNILYTEGDIEKTMKLAANDVEGAYSIIAAANIEDVFSGAFAYRDGTRPLAFAETPDFYALASETGHLDLANIDKKDVEIVAPGILHKFQWDGDELLHGESIITEDTSPACFFEGPIYLRLVSSLCEPMPPQFFDKFFLDYLSGRKDIANYKPSPRAVQDSSKRVQSKTAREILGKWLYRLRGDEIPKEYKFVSGVPMSGLSTGYGVVGASVESRKPLRYIEAITPNPLYQRMCPRDFLRSQDEREKNKIPKLIYQEDMPKHLILCEDSVVTGVTLKENVIPNIRLNGGNKPVIMIASPPIIAPCDDGINMKGGRQLSNEIYPGKGLPELRYIVTHELRRYEEKAADFLGAEKVLYIPPEALKMLLGDGYSFGCIGGTCCGAHCK